MRYVADPGAPSRALVGTQLYEAMEVRICDTVRSLVATLDEPTTR
jgi:hypothetical protein